MTTPINESLEQIVNIFSEVPGLEFTKSISTNSWYNHLLNIRISDHYSKFTTKKGTGSHDFVNPDLDYLIKKVFKSQWFSKLRNGVKIAHVNSKIGEIQYISHDEQRETVEVLKVNENRIVNYFFDVIVIL